MNKTAIITGASSGIGYEFARRLAEQHLDLILVARSEVKLQSMAAELSKKYDINAHVIAADLSVEYATNGIVERVKELGIHVNVLINNAGFGTTGLFVDNDPVREHEEIMLNISTVADMTHAFLPDMIKKGEGTVINVASTASFQPIPYFAVYSATKAFVLSFTEALWGENRQTGVQFLALCPGATETNFFNVAGGSFGNQKMRTSEQVVNTALKALKQGKSYVIDGKKNYIRAQSSRFFPRKWVAAIAGSIARPKN